MRSKHIQAVSAKQSIVGNQFVVLHVAGQPFRIASLRRMLTCLAGASGFAAVTAAEAADMFAVSEGSSPVRPAPDAKG